MVSMEEMAFCAWSRNVEECLKEYNVSLEKGLSFQEVEKQRRRYGWNELQKESGKPLWKLILEQFNDTLVKILLAAACISFILAYLDKNDTGEGGMTAYVEPFVILLILMLNAIVGAWQETNAEKALEALKEMQSEQAKVLRDGYCIPHLPARELVPGDIVELRVGDKVPADMRIASLKTSTLRMEQSSLTGESHPVIKSTNTVLMDDCEVQAKECMVFAGTTVVNGCCTCIVVNIGMSTEIGQIQAQIQEASLEDDDTPLKKKLDEFGAAVVDSDQFPAPLYLRPAISNSLAFRKVCSETDLHRLGKQRGGRSNYGDSPANQNLRIKSMMVPDKQCSVRGAGEGRQEREVNVNVNPICIGGGGGGGFRRAAGGNSDANSNNNNDTDAYYQKLLESDPGNPLLLSNYARFLHEVKHDMEKAEEYYARAMLASPGDGDVSTMYAKLIWEVGKDPQRAEIYFNRAVQAAPHDCYVLASHAHFLWTTEEEEEEEGRHIVTDSHEHFCDSTSRSVAAAYC